MLVELCPTEGHGSFLRWVATDVMFRGVSYVGP